MKEIPLTQGKVALVDDADFELVNQFKWFANRNRNTWYAVRNTKRHPVTRKQSRIYLHRFLTGFNWTDHRDGDGLNNRRKNLRAATRQQNVWAKWAKKKNCTSNFRGVFSAKPGKWVVRIRVSGKRLYLGTFNNEILAAKAYDIAARKYFGEFAAPNFNN